MLAYRKTEIVFQIWNGKLKKEVKSFMKENKLEKLYNISKPTNLYLGTVNKNELAVICCNIEKGDVVVLEKMDYDVLKIHQFQSMNEMKKIFRDWSD